MEFDRASDGAEVLDFGARRQLPRWLVRSAVGVAGVGVFAAAALTPSVETGHGSPQLPTPPAHQAQLYQPLAGHFLL